MIREQEFYHGAALARLLSRCSSPIEVKVFQDRPGSYILNGKIGIYIKYSTHRMSPWRFTFVKAHQDEIAAMKRELSDVFLLLVCETDGIATLSFEELKIILDSDHAATEWVSATRRKREMYRIKGSDGALDFKIADSDFSKKILRSLGLIERTELPGEEPQT